MGEPSKYAIYFHLEKSFNIEKTEIPHKIKDFADALEKIFGMGAGFLEILIMKRLYEKTGRIVKLHVSEDFTFLEYVAATKRSFLEKKKVQEESAKCRKMEIEA